MQKIKMGVIGTGMAWERLHYPAIEVLNDKYQVVAVCDKKRQKAEKAGRSLGLDNDSIYTNHIEMLKRDDLDVVDIAVPISQNYNISVDVAKAGKNIICEKPLASNIGDAIRYIELPKEYGVAVMIAENYRYNEENNKIRELIEEGRIGDIVYFIMNDISCFPCEMTKDTFYSKEWRQHPDFRGGNFLDSALHNLAALHHIFGGVDKVFAFGKEQKDDFSPYMYISANLRFKNNVIGHYSYFPNGKEGQKPLLGFRIFGQKGMIYLEERTCGIINIVYNNGRSEQIPYTPKRGYYNEFLNFYNALIGKESISVTPEIEFGDVELVFDILDSIEENRVNRVDTWSPNYQVPQSEESKIIHRYH